MLYITQLIYLNEGQEAAFDEFESVAIPLISKYNGRLLLRVRPDKDAFIAPARDQPYEIHLVSFEHERDFEAFVRDDERKKFIHLKEQSVRESTMILGTKR